MKNALQIASLLALVLTVSSCQKKGESQGSTAPNAQEAAKAPVAEAHGGPNFEHTADAVLQAAKSNGKPTILVFSASWCGPCQEMKKDVYPSAAVKPFHEQFNWAYLDIDVPANGKLFESHKLESVPHLLFLNASGKVIDQQEGGLPPEEFAKKLQSVLKKAETPKTAAK
jgi:thioredoxin-related protein